MSRMRVPEMDVIRFNESDVIVASGLNLTLTVSNVSNGIPYDDTLTLNGGEYSVQYDHHPASNDNNMISYLYNHYKISPASQDGWIRLYMSDSYWEEYQYLMRSDDDSRITADLSAFNTTFTWDGSRFIQ